MLNFGRLEACLVPAMPGRGLDATTAKRAVMGVELPTSQSSTQHSVNTVAKNSSQLLISVLSNQWLRSQPQSGQHESLGPKNPAGPVAKKPLRSSTFRVLPCVFSYAHFGLFVAVEYLVEAHAVLRLAGDAIMANSFISNEVAA